MALNISCFLGGDLNFILTIQKLTFHFDSWIQWRSMVTTSKSMHREFQIKHDLMTRKCKYTLAAFPLPG